MSREKFSKKTTLAERLGLVMNSAGLKRSDLLLKVRISKGHLSNILSGEREASDRLLEDMASVLGVRSDWLKTGEGEMRPAPALQEAPSLYKGEPRSWEAALKPCLVGTPLEDSLPVAELAVGPDLDASWRALPNGRKDELRQALRRLASFSFVLEGLPEDLAGPLEDDLVRHLHNYITGILRAHAEGH